MNRIYRIKTAIDCGLRRGLLRNNHLFKATFKLFASLDANNALANNLAELGLSHM